MDADLINRIAFIVLIVGFTAYLALQCYLQFSWWRAIVAALPGLFFAMIYLLVQKGTELQLWIAAGILAAFMFIMVVSGTAAIIVVYTLKRKNDE